MKLTYFTKEEEITGFGKEAAGFFAQCPSKTSYGKLEPESFLALRWGHENRSVLVLKLDESFEPVVFQDCLTVENDDVSWLRERVRELEAQIKIMNGIPARRA